MAIKTIFKILKYTFLTLLAITALYLLFAFLLSIISTSPEKINCTQKETIYLSSNGIHLDIIINIDQIDSIFLEELNFSDRTQYLAFGWGDKGFYLNTPRWEDLKAKTVIRAFFLPSETAMHVTQYRNTRKKWIPVQLCPEQLEKMQQFIISSFKRNDNGKFQPIANSGYGHYDTFYEAIGSYNAINTCNEWVNKALKKAEVKTAIWSPSDKGILYHFQNSYVIK